MNSNTSIHVIPGQTIFDTDFLPKVFIIDDITNAQFATVTFTEAHDYIDNQLVSFRIPRRYGMWQLNNVTAKVISHDTLSIVIDVDTTNWPAFSDSGVGRNDPPCCVPAGAGIDYSLYTPTVLTEDCFDNLPPT